MPVHKQVRIRQKGNRSFLVDVKLAKIIHLLLKHKVQTVSSCQGDNDTEAYLGFGSLRDIGLFMNLVARRDTAASKELSSRIYRATLVDNKWGYRMVPMSWNQDGKFRGIPKGLVDFWIYITFPQSDISLIEACLAETQNPWSQPHVAA